MKIEMKMVNGKIMRAAYEKYVGKATNGKADDDVAKELQTVLKKVGVPLVDCSDCGGSSPSSLDHCPFCGAADDVEVEGPDDEDIEEGASIEVPPVIEAAKPAKVRKLVVKAEPVVDIVKVENHGMLGGADPEKKLNDTVKQVQKMKGNGAEWAWKLGHFVRTELYDTELWRMRKRSDGTVGIHKSFEAFVKDELDLNASFVYRMMNISKEFALKDAVEYGTTKLNMILSAPKEDREELKERLDKSRGDKEMVVEELASEAKRLRKERGIKEVGGIGAKYGKPRNYKTKPGRKLGLGGLVKENPSTTVIFKTQKGTVRLYKQENEESPAKKLGDVPVGQMACVNDVLLKFQVVADEDGALKLKWEVYREE